MNDLRRAWGPSAITRWSAIAGAMALIVLAVPVGRPAPGFTMPVRVLTACGAALAAASVLYIAWLTWLRPDRQHLRPAPALLAFALAGAVAGASRTWLIDAAGAQDPFGVARRIGATTVAAVIWLSLTAIVVDHLRGHRATMDQLQRKRSELEELDRREREELEALATRLRTDLLAPVHATLDRIRLALEAVAAGGHAVAEARRIERAVETSIRPLSHEILAAEPSPTAPAVVGNAPARQRLARLAAQASRQVVRSPWLVTLVPVVLSPIMLGPSWGIVFLLINALVTWPIYSLLLVGLKRILDPHLPKHSIPAAATTLVGGYAMATALILGVTTALGGLSPRPVPYMWIGIVTLTAILVAASVLQAASELAADDEAALRDVLAGIALSLARIQQRLRHEHQVLGSLLHGPIQGALLAVARSLESASAQLPTEGKRALVDDAVQRLAEVERRLEAPEDDGQTIDDALEGVLMLWARVIDVDLVIDDGARAALDATPAARGAVADVLAEALTNAFRHGGARTAWVEISLDPRGARMRVIDDGELGTVTATGMGSRLYDECAHEWSLGRLDDGRTEMLLIVPMKASAGARRAVAVTPV